MRFFFYTLGDESVPVPPPTPELMEEMGRFIDEAVKDGSLIATGGMGPTALGGKVTRKGDDYTVTDGPFAEAKEHLAGFYLVDCDDEARALEIAARVPDAVWGLVEVRPVLDTSEWET